MKNYEKVFLSYSHKLIRKYQGLSSISEKAHMLCGLYLACDECPLKDECHPGVAKDINRRLVEWADSTESMEDSSI